MILPLPWQLQNLQIRKIRFFFEQNLEKHGTKKTLQKILIKFDKTSIKLLQRRPLIRGSSLHKPDMKGKKEVREDNTNVANQGN